MKHLSAGARAGVTKALEPHLRYEPRKASKSRIKRRRGVSKPQYRLRIGDLRVFYDVAEGVVEIVAIVTQDDAEVWLQRAGEVS